ncbi:peptide-methionine (R)-S-oxide reductase MsrB [Roseovarius sp.]|jgi:peptide-methionine (R)-S-oxide reductase|uniref:peptide-methionine (R)-S-oxide reductase MsrB n=1 Tax=Roseovarius sp. TaxID=1486281 RepID=UPI00260B830C|nr:peptide-methionine (R)-S-oxide reductase MsrB [Roseovarius sp.]MDM8166610.1 peptide-methionine (R)-S-oxide reductase MsrB [Roseovarius sp.]
MDRRGFIAMILLGGTAVSLTSLGAASSASGNFEVTRTEAEWRNMLTDLQYKVMREEGTEPAGSSPLDKQYSAGTYHCRGCDLPLYPSDTKYDSGTGWPSFYRPLENAVETKRDFKLIYPRTEVHCRRCGSHLGHIFNDGPEPTGKRHCLNGVSLVFKPA